MTICSAVKTRPSAQCPGAGAAIIGKVSAIVRRWRDSSRKRRVAFELDDRTLRDIGLTRLEVAYLEATMPLYERAAQRWS